MTQSERVSLLFSKIRDYQMEHVGGSVRDHACDIQEHMADQKQWNDDEREWYQISDTAMIVVLQKYYKDVKLAFENSVKK